MNDPAPNALAPGSIPAKRTGRRLVLLLTMAASVGYLCRVDITVVAPRLMAELGLSQPEMGKVFGAFLHGYTLFQIPSGWLAGRVPTRPLFFALALGWTALTFTNALVGRPYLSLAIGTLPWLMVLRFVLGILAAPTYPAAGRAISLSVSPERQGSANGMVLASIGIGSAVTPPLLGFVTLHWGWRPALLVAALLAALAALFWRWLVPPAQIPMAARPSQVQAGTTACKSPLRSRSFWFLTASYTLQGYVGYVFVFWFFLYLVQVRRFELLQAAWLTTLPWILSLLVIPLGGVASDWAVKRWGSTWGRRALPLPALTLGAEPDRGHGARPCDRRPVLGLHDHNLGPAQRNRGRGHEFWKQSGRADLSPHHTLAGSTIGLGNCTRLSCRAGRRGSAAVVWHQDRPS
ncbi:MAG: MFS transporter [Terriglobia bacterium]